MNPGGPAEEVGKAAGAAIEALKSTPVILALLIFNALFMVMLGFVWLKSSERWEREIDRWETLVKACQNVTVREKQQF
jgi:ABC-type uncharacterized transport system permease subunit